jgi:hypothetical protein
MTMAHHGKTARFIKSFNSLWLTFFVLFATPIVHASSGIEINGVSAECDPNSQNEICESKVNLSIKNLTGKPQRYLLVKLDLYGDKGNKLNDSCLSGYELIDFGDNLSENAEKEVTVLYRKYLKYASAKLVSSKWYGLTKPSLTEAYPEIDHVCP